VEGHAEAAEDSFRRVKSFYHTFAVGTPISPRKLASSRSITLIRFPQGNRLSTLPGLCKNNLLEEIEAG